jgi:hypothetical protein
MRTPTLRALGTTPVLETRPRPLRIEFLENQAGDHFRERLEQVEGMRCEGLLDHVDDGGSSPMVTASLSVWHAR